MILKIPLGFILFFTSYVAGYEYDIPLSNKLHKDYKKLITKTSIGRDVYLNRFNNMERPTILLRYSDDIGYAWYDPKKNIITLNTKYIMIFFNIENYDDKKMIDVFYFSDRTREELINYTDVVFFHEMVHAYQNKLYPSLMDPEKNFFIELEYEAYFLSDLYFFEKMKNNKKFFLKILKNEYMDLYTSDAISGFFALITDLNEYKNIIKKRYQNELKGYVSLTDEEKKRKALIEEKKLLSYAIGKKENLWDDEKKLDEIMRLKEVYQRSVNDFYNKKYYDANCRGISYVLENSVKIRNYYLSFKCGYYFKKNRCSYSQKKAYFLLNNLEEEFNVWISSNKNKISDEDLYLTLKAYDEYLSISAKDFPYDKFEIRNNIYLRTLLRIKKELENERDEVRREEYIKELDFLYQKLGSRALETLP
jgi:hypothetical protein